MKWWNTSAYRRILFAVTAVDEKGREGLRSEPIEVEVR